MKPDKETCRICGEWRSEVCEKCNVVVWSWRQWQDYKGVLDSEISKLKENGIEPPKETSDEQNND